MTFSVAFKAINRKYVVSSGLSMNNNWHLVETITSCMFGLYTINSSLWVSLEVIWLQSRPYHGLLTSMVFWQAEVALLIDAFDSGTLLKCKRSMPLKLGLKSAIYISARM